MRHKDTISLREMMKGYTAQDTDAPTDQQEGLPMPPMAVVRGQGEPIPLEDWDLSPFAVLLENRRSRRKYADAPVTLEELSFLLWAAQGVKSVREHCTLRTVPSAGARHPLECYAVINHVAGLAPGLYHYLALEHRLEEISRRPDQKERLTYALAGQRFAGEAPVCLIWTAVPYRTEWRYDGKAQKYALLDAGHACENVYLACESLGLGCCAIAAYDQEALDALLELPSGPSDDRETEFAVYACSVGRPVE